MAIQFMKFKHSDYAVDFSETTGDDKMLIAGYGKGNSIQIYLDENEMKELRKWVSKQLRNINTKK